MPTIAELKAAFTDPRYYAEVGQGLLDSFNRGAVGGLLGTPVDMANGVVNAGKMVAGYVGHKTGLLSPGQMPQPDTAPIGGAEWWGEKMQDAGMVSGNRNIPAEMLMGVAGIPLTGAAAAKVMPKVEQGLLAAAKNAVNPATLNVPAYGGQRGAIVWHGSPHKFSKFDMSKIGTGEGAQAYGHGLYMAEAPEVAKDYAGALSAARSNKPVGNVDLQQVYQSLPNDVPDTLLAARRDFRALNESGELSAADRRDFLDAVKGNITASRGGNLYKVDIPDEAVARFLDWDKPLSQQAPEVQKALSAMRDKLPSGMDGWDIRPFMDADPLFSTFHNSAVRDLGVNPDFFASNFKQSGIHGIRYLDGGSRGEGQGTSNFVLFSDDLARILERNGAPTGLEPWKPGEWSAK